MRYSHRHTFRRPNPITEPAAVMRALCIVRVDFIGEFITKTVAMKRDEEGFGGYMIAYTNDIVYDSYNFLSVCKASMANCPRNCYDSNRRCSAEANARLTIDRRRRRLSLRALVDIGPMTEILWNYGVSYRYPTVS